MQDKPIKYIIYLVAIITTINIVFIFLFSLIWNNLEISYGIKFIYYFLAAFCAALLISFLVISTAPVLKDILATYRRFLRLENLSHPLLLKLSLEAPGTYHHSLAVANLAYRAAKTIGADPLLTRIGAYYHDIGKVVHPEYYIENQKEGHNIHDQIVDAKKSFKMITEHVKEGVKLAEEHKLPKEVISFIPEHQGTQLTHFYQKAKNTGKKIKKNDFRYAGPKPLSRETAITMLADIIEARIRLLDKVTPPSIEEIVESSIKDKVEDNQLELSGLTQHEINTIKQSYIDTLEVMYHSRIQYNNELDHEKR